MAEKIRESGGSNMVQTLKKLLSLVLVAALFVGKIILGRFA